ncbi:hypothetical protein HN670_02295 [bacterium]|jgi:type II secretory pathway component PulF|nr:hypothetical protein [bacterium]
MLDRLAQAEEVMENLVDSEVKLQELNQELNHAITEYSKITQNIEPMSFFNFSNVYFWFVVCGLLLLAFGFWFLLVELKSERRKNKTHKCKKEKLVKSKTKTEFKDYSDSKPVAAKPKKAFKVAVRKVK